jgi:uncharacterized glyoxalase superfamily protein PhnB
MREYSFHYDHRSYFSRRKTMAVPYLIVNNAAKAIDFYREVFGAGELMRLSAPDGKIAHAELMFAEGRIMLADEYPDMEWASPNNPKPPFFPNCPILDGNLLRAT